MSNKFAETGDVRILVAIARLLPEAAVASQPVPETAEQDAAADAAALAHFAAMIRSSSSQSDGSFDFLLDEPDPELEDEE